MRIYNLPSYIIEVPDDDVFLHDSNFVKITRKSTLTLSVVVQGSIYYFYNKNTIIVDVTDFLRALFADGGGGMTIAGAKISFRSGIKGFEPLVSEIMPPKFIPYGNLIEDFNITYLLPQYNGLDWELFDTKWIKIGVVNICIDTVIIPYITKTKHPLLRIKNINNVIAGSTFNSTFDNTFVVGTMKEVDNSIYFHLVPLDCGIEYFFFKWTGENGSDKMWFFKNMGTDRKFENKVDLCSVENPDGYNVFKNKMVNLTVGIEKADLLTRKYIADIVFADDVLMRDNDNVLQRVFIENKNFSVGEKETFEDISFNVGFRNFKTV